MMELLDGLFWWSGLVLWTIIAVLVIAFGWPGGHTIRGVTRFTFYDVGPVLWRELPDNATTLTQLRKVGYHFVRVWPGVLLGFSLPVWVSRRLFAKKPEAPRVEPKLDEDALQQGSDDEPTPMQAAPQMVCSQCGVDRFRQPCPGPHSTCPIRANAQTEG